ncbi:MAG: PilZ domain-containing protein [Candidatus Aminicenantes bacterium]|nr:PilZ domain-containing protein [Candidatus Aminicenantes bacterium]
MEERKEERKKKRLLLKIGEDKGMMVDITKMGLRVMLEKFPPGEAVDISFKVNDQAFNLKGTIHWVEIKQTLDQEPYEMGLSLINPGDDFMKFVESLPKEADETDKPGEGITVGR